MLGNNTNNSEYIIDTLRVDISSAAQDIVDNLPDVTTMATKDDVNKSEEDIKNSFNAGITSIMHYVDKVGYPILVGRQFVNFTFQVWENNIKNPVIQRVQVDFYQTFLQIHIMQDIVFVDSFNKYEKLNWFAGEWQAPESEPHRSTYLERLNRYFNTADPTEMLYFPLIIKGENNNWIKKVSAMEEKAHIYLHFSSNSVRDVNSKFYIPAQTIHVSINGFYNGETF